jgi:hypothetical protein
MNLKAIAHTAGEGLGAPSAPVQVLVDLTTRTVEPSCLGHLEDLGLTVSRVIGNKVLGTIAGENLAALRDDSAVAEVEISSQLRPHAE